MALYDQCGVTMKHNENLFENVLMIIDYEIYASPKCSSNKITSYTILKP